MVNCLVKITNYNKMEIYKVDMITDLNEQVSVCVQANDQSEAEAIAVSMLENGELECIGRICASYSSYTA